MLGFYQWYHLFLYSLHVSVQWGTHECIAQTMNFEYLVFMNKDLLYVDIKVLLVDNFCVKV